MAPFEGGCDDRSGRTVSQDMTQIDARENGLLALRRDSALKYSYVEPDAQAQIGFRLAEMDMCLN